MRGSLQTSNLLGYFLALKSLFNNVMDVSSQFSRKSSILPSSSASHTILPIVLGFTAFSLQELPGNGTSRFQNSLQTLSITVP